MPNRSYAALLIDLDGTLVDSEPKHFQAHRAFLASKGLTPSEEQILGNVGKGDRSFYHELARQAGVTIDAEEWVLAKIAMLADIYRSEGLAIKAGVQALLDHAWREGICCAVVTSSPRHMAVLSLEVTGLAERLPIRICSEDTVAHKPDPAPYLLASRRLGVPPQRCLVIEDSVSGVEAGCAAGMTVIGYAGLISAERLLAAGAKRCVSSLAELVPLEPVTVRVAR